MKASAKFLPLQLVPPVTVSTQSVITTGYVEGGVQFINVFSSSMSTVQPSLQQFITKVYNLPLLQKPLATINIDLFNG